MEASPDTTAAAASLPAFLGDGACSDPAALPPARADFVRLSLLRQDAQVARVVDGEDDEALQALLREIFEARPRNELLLKAPAPLEVRTSSFRPRCSCSPRRPPPVLPTVLMLQAPWNSALHTARRHDAQIRLIMCSS